MNILLLMAGGDEMFREAGYLFPKNLVEIDGLPLVERVIGSLDGLRSGGGQLITCLREEEVRTVHTDEVIHLLDAQATVISAPAATAGAACSALLAIEQIDNDAPLLILNGDIVLEIDQLAVLDDFQRRQLDGGIVVFEAIHPRWSFVRCDSNGYVVEAAEKRPISNLATAGFYYFARGRDFVQAAMSMIKKDAHVDGRFYICPAYNEMVLRQARIGVFKIARNAYFSLANPSGVQAYEEYLRHQKRKMEDAHA